MTQVSHPQWSSSVKAWGEVFAYPNGEWKYKVGGSTGIPDHIFCLSRNLIFMSLVVPLYAAIMVSHSETRVSVLAMSEHDNENKNLRA
jgi:hypothetical protein